MPIVKMEMHLLSYWMREREHIRQAKDVEHQPKPWSLDMIFQNYRWCNVRRMDDKVSQWLLNNYYTNEATSRVIAAYAVLARMINWPDSLEPFCKKVRWMVDSAFFCLDERRLAKKKVFTGAYIIPSMGEKDKIRAVVDLADSVYRNFDTDVNLGSMKNCWDSLMGFRGFGSFLAGQVVADLRHTRVGENWKDAGAWAPMGPGSKRGMNRLFGRDKNKAMTQTEFEDALLIVMGQLHSIPTVNTLMKDRRLEAMDVQNCLCEFDKYRRLSLREGKVRAKYDGADEDTR